MRGAYLSLLGLLLVAGMLIRPTPPVAQDHALGVFLDHRGDGAIELAPCGGKLCGHVVWVRDGVPAAACGAAVIGDVAPVSAGVWDGGWILDPEANEKFDVEITQISAEEIQVMGYWGTKELSETFVWKRAPRDLPRCGAVSAQKAALQ